MGKVPEDWRMADATAAFRKGVEDGVCNLEVGWPHLCSWGGDVTACCRCHCHVTGGEGICKEQSRWMDRGEVMPDQKVALCVVLIVQLEERRVADSNACCAGAQLTGMSGVWQ